MHRWLGAAAGLLAICGPAAARAQPAAVEAEDEEEAGDARGVPVALDFHGAMEFYYAYNLNNPRNGVTNWRWYDHRHDHFSLQGLWFAPQYQVGPVTGRFQLQLGALPELLQSREDAVGEDRLWHLLVEARMAWRTPWKRLSVEGGIFPVPFGPEWNMVSRNWNWSTSNLLALMPSQLAGARLNLAVGRSFMTRLGVFNGWDRVVADNNDQKTLFVALEWGDPKDAGNYVVADYMLGNERDRDDPRGRATRHTFDVYGQWHAARPLFLRLWTFSGFERRAGATDGWFGLAAFVRVEPLWWFAVAGRGDYVYTRASTWNLFHGDMLADYAASTALGSGTLTFDFRPHARVSLRIEGRHDRASFPLYYRGIVPLADPLDRSSFVANARHQTTVLVGMTTWF